VVKQRIAKKTHREMVADFPITRMDAPDWYFRYREVSANFYVAEGRDAWGRSVQRQGTDPDTLLNQCAEDVRTVSKNG
jgi:hypothetical protein